VFALIGEDFKGTLHFFEGSGKKGRLIQKDYIRFLDEVVAPEWDWSCILVEDNDKAYGTAGAGPNMVKTHKEKLQIRWLANPANSPDLNPIEKIWRIIKQRLKNRGGLLLWRSSERLCRRNGTK
jgi:DDE superfamily endonuclease